LRTAILGAAGQLGSDLVRLLGEEALPLGRGDADLTNADSLRQALQLRRPQLVINCAAFNFVDRAEREPDAAFAVNASAVHHLARVCRELDVPLLHVSTDYVFGRDAERCTPYRETELPAPTCVYGTSKLAGEYLAQLWEKHFVVRTCGLFGLAGRTSRKGNFVEMILRQVAEGKPLKVVDDQRCTPTSSADLAVALVALAKTNKYGLFHLTNAGDCSWLEFAHTLLDLAGIQQPIQPVTTASFGSPARRPAYSVMANDAAIAAGVTPMRHWREALADYLHQRSRSSA
jgi:dTDP-4-dehydrorhamnose reductase